MRLFLHQLRADQLIFWRSREAAVFVFLFPVMLFLLLGAVYSGDSEYEGRPISEYLLVGLLGYGVANTALGGLAITLVLRREQGVLKRVRATPLPPAVFLGATLASTLIVFALQATAIVVLARLVFGARLPPDPLSLVLALVFGALAFAGMGFGLASLVRSQEGVSPIVNVIVLPMAFLSGGFAPREQLPDALAAVAEVLPLRYLIDTLRAIYLDGEPVWEQPLALAVVAGWGVAGLLTASRRFRWHPREG